MPVIKCEQCRQNLRIPDGVFGKTVRCPHCGNRFSPESPGFSDVRAAPSRPIQFTVAFKNDPKKVLKGSRQATVMEDGLRLTGKKEEPILIPVGSSADYLGGNRLAVMLNDRQVEIRVSHFRTYQKRLARDLAAFLKSGKPLNPRGYTVEWYLLVPAILPLGIPVMTLGGALPGALGFGLAAGCYAVAQKEEWPPAARMITSLGLAGLGYFVVIAVAIATMLARGGWGEFGLNPGTRSQISGDDSGAVHRPSWMRREPDSPTERPGLIGYWSFDEESGDRVADLSGDGAEGLLHGGKRVSGIKGKALLLNGSTDYFEFGVSPRLNFSASHPFTFAGWFQCANRAGCIVSLRKNNEEGAVIDIEIDRAGRLAALVREDHGEKGTPAQITGGRVNDGQWHHFALTRNAGNRIELFLDGTSQGQARGANAGGAITTDLRAQGSERYWVMHNENKYGIPYLAGALDEFCVFDRELAKSEVEGLAGK